MDVYDAFSIVAKNHMHFPNTFMWYLYEESIWDERSWVEFKGAVIVCLGDAMFQDEIFKMYRNLLNSFASHYHSADNFYIKNISIDRLIEIRNSIKDIFVFRFV